MVVTHIVRQFHPAVGGFEDVVLNLAKGQRDKWGVDARVVTLDRLFTDPATRLEPRAVVDGVPVVRIPWRGSSRYPLAPTVLAHLSGSDIVHVHAIDFFFDFLARTRFLHRRPLVASTQGGFFHTQDFARLKRIWFRTLTRQSVRAYDAIVAVSGADARLFNKISGERLIHIETGVNLNKFPPRPFVDRDRRRIVTFGRVTRHKQVGQLVRLLVELLGREPDWTLAIAGPAGDDSIDALLQPAIHAGVRQNVEILGSLPEHRLADEIARATWFASASAYEGFGLAAVEAAASGLIPVLSAIPTFTQLIDRLGCGFLFDPADLAPVAAAMIECAARPASHIDRVRAQIISRVTPLGMAASIEAHVQLYRRILQRTPDTSFVSPTQASWQ